MRLAEFVMMSVRAERRSKRKVSHDSKISRQWNQQFVKR